MTKPWEVIRNCCTSGNCIQCIDKTPFGTPMRIRHVVCATKKEADEVVRNWKTYKAEAKEVQ